jgi:hypothetical protein
MKPFKLPAWRKAQLNRKISRQERVAAKAIFEMEKVMRDAVDHIINQTIAGTDHFPMPTLNGMFKVTEDFYKEVVKAALVDSRDEKSEGKKRLARLPFGMPRTLKDFEKLFRDKRKWPLIMKRSKLLTERLRKAYVEKLKKRFNSIIPQLRSGEMEPFEAKKELREAFGATRARVNTMFQTETTTYFAKAQVAFFEDDEQIIGFLFDSLADTSRTPICKSRTSLLVQNTPACHFGCRSHLIALANNPENRKMLEDPRRDPEKVAVVPLPKGWGK